MNKKSLSFDEWMQETDGVCGKLYGVSIEDLPDCCYRDWYDDGKTPGQAARKAYKNTPEKYR